MDYLSYLTYLYRNKGIRDFKLSTIILNSTSLKKQLLKVVSDYQFKSIYFFLDNDDAGRDTFDYFEQTLSDQNVIDKSSVYEGYKDFNAMISGKPQQTNNYK